MRTLAVEQIAGDSHVTSMRKWWLPIVVVPVALLCGVVVGTVTNTVNAIVSAEYFTRVMRFHEQIIMRSILQGMVEGGALGAAFGILFSLGDVIATGLRSPLFLVLRGVFAAILVVLVCWTLGGVAGLAWQHADPASFGTLITLAPINPAAQRRFAWVGGTILGAYFGTIIACVYATFALHRWWLAFKKPGFPVLNPKE